MQNDNRPVILLVLGILSIFFCQLLGPVAWIMGNNYRDSCQLEGVEPQQLGTVGRILGMVGTGLLLLNCVLGGIFGILEVILIFASNR